MIMGMGETTKPKNAEQPGRPEPVAGDSGVGEALIRVRMSSADAHYAGELVDGAKMLQLFGDVATELLIRLDGDEGLFLTYEKVEFLAPVFAGDYVEARGRIVKIGRTSRHMEFEARKVITAARVAGQPSAANVLAEPVVTTRAYGICVAPADKQRGKAGGGGR